MLLALLGAASISSSAIIVRLAHAAAGTTGFYRCVLALPGLVALSGLEQRRHGPRPVASRMWAVAAGGFLGIDLVLWTHAIYDVGAGVATVLSNLQVLFVAFIAWVLWRERPRPLFLLALPVVLAGVVLVGGLAGRATTGNHPLAGVVYGLGTSLAYAAFILVLRHHTTGIPHVAGPLADATAGSAVMSLVLGVAFHEMQFAPPLSVLGWLLLLALASQTLGWLLITSALPRLPAAVSSLLLLVQPAASLVLAAVVLAQRPTLLQILGAVLVCGGVVFVTRSSPEGEVSTPEPAPS